MQWGHVDQVSRAGYISVDFEEQETVGVANLGKAFQIGRTKEIGSPRRRGCLR
jgi:hypothetical protein